MENNETCLQSIKQSAKDNNQVQHVLIIQEDETPRIVHLESATYTIGRHAGNSIILTSKVVSRHHATLLRVTNPGSTNHSFRIIDGDLLGKNSTNGLTVNGKRVFSHDLQSGDLIILGENVTVRYYTLSNLADLEVLSEKNLHRFVEQSPYNLSIFSTIVESDFNLKSSHDAAILRLASIPELNPYPILEVDLSGKVTYLNPAATIEFPRILHEATDHPLLNHLIPDLKQQSQDYFTREVRVGEKIFEQTVHYIAESSIIRSYVIEITQRKRVEEKLLYDALYDSLTCLPNRAWFLDKLGHAIETSKLNQEHQFAVLFVDLDRFKIVNDSLGHHCGDLLLIEFAQRLSHGLDANCMAARLGGDEFSVLVESMSQPEDAIAIAEQIQRCLRRPFSLNGHEIFMTASIGIAIGTDNYGQPEELLRDADIAMYRAKALGKARYHVFHPSMYIKALSQLHLENDLRRAVDRQEFLLHYQPIVAIESGELIGFEALLRWLHPEEGLLAPNVFIPVAEETGLIIDIGYWVIREACSQLQVWQQKFYREQPLTVSVNISGKQFSQMDLPEKIGKILQETHLPASSLKLEITESVIMENAELAAQTLLNLRALGLQIYIDDFGTGYSSLSYLHSFPLNALKIDRSFIKGIASDHSACEIVQIIILLAKSLGICVVAEGLETTEQLDKLKTMGCVDGLCQGYLFSKPLSPADLEQSVLNR